MANKSFEKNLGGASLLIIAFTIISKGIGFIREVIYASEFGLSWQYDIYLVSAAIPLLIHNSILYLGQNYFIPEYHQAKNTDNRNLKEFISEKFFNAIVVGFILSILFFVFRENLLTLFLDGVNPEKILIANNLFSLLLIAIPLFAGFSILSAFFNAEYIFQYNIYSRLSFNIVFVFLLIVLTESKGIFAIPIAYLAASVLQLFLAIFFSRQYLKFRSTFFNIKRIVSNLKSSKLGLTVLAEILIIGFVIIDRYFYTKVDSGGIAALGYATMLFAFPISTISLGLSTTIFSKFSDVFQKKDKVSLNYHLQNSVGITILVFIPIMYVLLFHGEYIVELIYQRGMFSSADTLLTSELLKIYSYSIVFYAAYSIFNKFLFGTNLVKELVYLSVSAIIIKTLLNFIFVNEFKQEGLAYATTIVYIYLSIGAALICIYKNKLSNKVYYLKNLSYYLIIALISYSVVYLLPLPSLSKHLANSVEVLIFLFSYFLILLFMKDQNLKSIMKIFRIWE